MYIFCLLVSYLAAVAILKQTSKAKTNPFVEFGYEISVFFVCFIMGHLKNYSLFVI